MQLFRISFSHTSIAQSIYLLFFISCPGLSEPWYVVFSVCPGHEYDDGVVTVEPGCDFWDRGKTTYTCIHCGKTYTKTLYGSHTYDQGVITLEPTCSRCHSTTEEALSFGEHRWDDGELTQRPTLDKVGEMTYICELCGTTRTEPAEPPAGDVSGDGVTDAADIVSLMKYILDQGDQVNNEALDVTDNGRVDILDVIRLIRHLADTSVQLS